MPWRSALSRRSRGLAGLGLAAYEQGERRQRGAIVQHYRSSERGRSSPRLSALQSQDISRTRGTDGTINYCFHVISLEWPHDNYSHAPEKRGPGRPKGLGRVPGSGRQKCTPNRTTAELRQQITTARPVEFLIKVG